MRQIKFRFQSPILRVGNCNLPLARRMCFAFSSFSPLFLGSVTVTMVSLVAKVCAVRAFSPLFCKRQIAPTKAQVG